MKNCTITIMVLCALGVSVGTSAAQESGLENLAELTSSWIQIREQIAQEERAWQQREPFLQREIKLLEAERETLLERKARTDAEMRLRANELAALEADRDRHAESMQILEAAVTRAEQELNNWRARVPDWMQAEAAHLWRALPAARQTERETSLTRRAQRVIALLTHLEQLQNELHEGHERIAITGGARQAQVLYIGLSHAFAVSPSGDGWAAIGVPDAVGWNWTERPEHAATIRKALLILRREQGAEIAHLPLWLAVEDSP